MSSLGTYGDLLKIIAEASRRMVGAAKGADASAYHTRLWKARLKPKDVIDCLPTVSMLSSNLELDNDHISGAISEFIKHNLVWELDLGTGNAPFYMVTVDGLEASRRLRQPLEAIDESWVAEIERSVSQVVRLDIYSKLSEGVVPGEQNLNGKLAIFGLFLLLTGAVVRESALIVEKDEAKRELEYLAALTEYLDAVAQRVFPQSHSIERGPKGGKEFRPGDLDNVFRRRSTLETVVGADVFRYEESAGLYYFDLYEQGELKENAFSALLSLLLGRLQTLALDEEWDPSLLLRAVDDYQYANPIKAAHRNYLFNGSPPQDWYFLLRYFMGESTSGAGTK